MRRHKKFVSIVCIIMALLMILSLVFMGVANAATSDDIAYQIDVLAAERDSLYAQMDAVQEQIDSLDYTKQSIIEQKAILDKKNELAQQELNIIQEQMDILGTYLENRLEDIEVAKDKETYQKEAWLNRLRAMEESSSLSYLDVVFDASSFTDLITRLELVNEVMESDEMLWNAYVASREEVERLEAEAEEMTAENEALKADYEETKAKLEEGIQQANDMILQIQNDIEANEQLLAEQAEAEASLEAMIAEYAVAYEEALAAEEEAAYAAYVAAGGSDTYGTFANFVSDGTAQLLWPSGSQTITSYYGYRDSPTAGASSYHEAVDIGASGGSNIYASVDGTVIYSGSYSGYGNTVIIQDANGYTYRYSHNSGNAVSVGDTVSQGQTIGYVGSTGISTGNHIDFGIYDSSGNSVDPLSFSYYYSS